MTTGPVDRVLIGTPEGCTFGLLLAGPLTRFLAWFIDLCCCVVALIVFAVVILLSPLSFAPGVAIALIVLGLFGAWFGYGVVMEWFWRGRTIGKMCLGLRVMDEQGLPLSFPQVLIRNLLRFVDALPALYMVAGITCMLTRRVQRLGDLAAGTVVVKTRQARRPDLGKVLGDKYNSFRAYPHLEARLRQMVCPQAARVALTSLMRREQLDAAARLDVYRQIADYFREIVRFPDAATEGLSDEHYVRNVVDSLYRSQIKR